jgi:hypothetical protein
MKKLLVTGLSCLLALSMVACGSSSSSANSSGSTTASSVSTESTATSEAAPASTKSTSSSADITGDYKIGIMTTTVSQSEESYRVAEQIKNKYPDNVTVVTFPDNFASEQETTISTAMSLASDPDIKAIVFSQAVQGTAAACQKIREVRPDILLICAGFQDDSATTSANCDVFFHSNVPKMGFQIVDEMDKLGVKTIVHYSFPRHLAWQPTADRLQNMKDEGAKKGIKIVEVTTPDPTSDAGTSGTQQFVLEDVPREVEKYGTQTAFFGTNTAQQEPMIKEAVETKSYYTYPSDPSVFVGYPAALGLEIPEDHAFEVDYYKQAIKDKLAEDGMTGHMGCWTAPVMTLFMNGSFEYAKAFCEGKTNGEKLDSDVFKSCLTEAAGADVDVENITDGGTTYDNGFYIMCSYEVF